MTTFRLQTTRDVIRYFLPRVRGRVLDVGAGTVKYKSLVETYSTGYVAFDAHTGPDIDVTGDIEHLPFADGSFDTVLCNQVFEHIPRPWVVAGEIKRILRPGGLCLITAPFFCPFHKDPEDYFRYTPDGLTSLCADAGLVVVESASYTPVFSTIFQMLEFTYFSPYAPGRNEGRWTQRFLRYSLKFAGFLDRFAKRHIIYGNSYVIARKV